MAGCLQHHKKGETTAATPSVPVRAAQDAGGQICINEQSFDAIDDIFASRLSAGPGPRMALGPGPGFRYNGGLKGSWGTKVPHLDDFWEGIAGAGHKRA
jgi:hypothetical protein